MDKFVSMDYASLVLGHSGRANRLRDHHIDGCGRVWGAVAVAAAWAWERTASLVYTNSSVDAPARQTQGYMVRLRRAIRGNSRVIRHERHRAVSPLISRLREGIASRVHVHMDTYFKSPEYVIRPRENLTPIILLDLEC